MRKLLTTAVAAVTVLALGGVAYAENNYTIDTFTGSPSKKGSLDAPLPISRSYQYSSTNTNPANRPSVAKSYRAVIEGHLAYPNIFPSCTFAQAGGETVDPACKKAKLGTGRTFAVAGPIADPTQKLYCNAAVTIYNVTKSPAKASKNAKASAGAVAVRLDADPPMPTTPDGDGCIIAAHFAIYAPLKTVKVDGVPSTELKFTTPPNVENTAGLESAFRRSASGFDKKVTRATLGGKERKLGFWNSVGCKGKTRTMRVVFQPADSPAVTATKEKKC